MQRNGVHKKCKLCDNMIYVQKSRLHFKKYCSKKCSVNDNFGFIPKNKQCIIRQNYLKNVSNAVKII